MFPNSRRSTLNSGCLLEDLEPSGNNLGQSVMTTSSSPSKTMNEAVCTNQLSAEDVVYKPRQNSAASLASTLSISADFCKICHCGGEPSAPLITPCFCSGSLKHVHQECLQKWIKSSDIKRCELCKYPFAMQSKVKPFCQWEKLDMSSMERRKLVCSVTFHVVAITCVVWSLYILIDRTADEIKTGDLKWPFWTKLVVVAIGFTGGLVFMYIQCKVYVHLCRKWKAYNRIIVVQEAPEGIQKPSHTSNKNIESCSGKEEDSCQSDSRSVVVATSTAAVSSKSNAETQTALRGVSIVAAGELKNATKIFKEIDHEHPEVFTARSPAGEATTFFFEECDCERDQDSSCSQAGTPSSTSQKQTAKGKGNRKSSSKNRRRTSESCTTDECQNAGLSQGDLPGSTLDLEAASRNDEGSSL